MGGGRESVKEYYEGFTDYLFRDRMYPNQRHVAIRRLLDAQLAPGASVCEIGCGIGILTEHVSRCVGSAGSVLALDLSESNVKLARTTVPNSNIDFQSADIFEFDAGGRRFDHVLLFDMIEHIPEDERPKLGGILGGLLNDNGTIVLTIPAPDHQRYRKEHALQELQVVDEVVTLEDVQKLAADSGTQVLRWDHVDVFSRNAYVHAVLCRGSAYHGTIVHPPLWQRLWWKGVTHNPLANAMRRFKYRQRTR